MPPFAVFCQPRSGSYHLVSLLASAPDIACHGEVFKPRRIEMGPQALAALAMRAEDVAARNDDPAGFVERLRVLPASGGILGFKLFVNHVTVHKGLRQAVLLSPRWSKIALHRHPAASYASRLRAETTGVWKLPAGRDVPAAVRDATVRFEPASFDRHMKEHERFLRMVSDAEAVPGNPVVRLDYDDLVSGAGLAGVLRFVGSEARAPALVSAVQRQSTQGLREGFCNWPEFEAHLAARGMVIPPA